MQVRSDLDTLLLPLLELLYGAHQRTPNQMYMLLIILLMLSQDAAFAQNVHRITLTVRTCMPDSRIPKGFQIQERLNGDLHASSPSPTRAAFLDL